MTDTIKTTELDLLKERATDMGVEFSPNIGIDKLRERVNAKLLPASEDEEVVTGTPTKAQRYRAVRLEATKLIRCKISCLNPNKKDSHGEWFRVGNAAVPTITRFVNFEEETHVPNILLNYVKTRQYAVVTHKKNSEGQLQPIKNKRKEFQIEILPALTVLELDELAVAQAKRGTV